MSLHTGGKGCIARAKVLCLDLRCNEASLSRTLKLLEENGYILREGNQRSRVLRVIYNSEDNVVASRSGRQFDR
jgi:DNA-binding MarR family transcriptional regulator